MSSENTTHETAGEVVPLKVVSVKAEDSSVFYPTEALKVASEHKPISSYIPDDGRDPNPAWDVVARSVWPATKYGQKDREALAEVLMWACNDDVVLGATPSAGIVMARMVQSLMGNAWMDRWVRDNYGPMGQRIRNNQRMYGGLRKAFKNFFSSY